MMMVMLTGHWHRLQSRLYQGFAHFLYVPSSNRIENWQAKKELHCGGEFFFQGTSKDFHSDLVVVLHSQHQLASERWQPRICTAKANIRCGLWSRVFLLRNCVDSWSTLSFVGWSDWSEWSSCSQTCDGGQQERHRECLLKSSFNKKKNYRNRRTQLPCGPYNAEKRNCNSFSCSGNNPINLGVNDLVEKTYWENIFLVPHEHVCL